jgi:predicted alpha-1,6-mannanase (GH76 family)
MSCLPRLVCDLRRSNAGTPPVVDQCFDDHQWWLLAWVRAYESTGVVEYVQRAAQIFDYVVEYAWNSQCGGGVLWCPVNPGSDGYKNAMYGI